MLILAAALAGATSAVIWSLLPRALDVRTEVVGFPIYDNFNVNRHYWLYWLAAGFFPLATLAIFLALTRLTGGARRRTAEIRPRQLARPEPHEDATGATAVLVAAARVPFVGSVFGIQAGIVFGPRSGWVLALALPVMLGYAGLAAGAATALGFLIQRSSFWERLSVVNALGAAFTVTALYAVSESTRVTVVATDTVRHYPWFPVWLAVGLTAILLAWIAHSSFTAFRTGKTRELERLVLVVLAGPTALFMFLAALTGDPGPMDLFQEGETLGATRLTAAGAFPWRDLMFIHGLTADVVKGQVGLSVLEDSRWGFMSGQTLLLQPIVWLSLYYLCAYLFRRNLLFLIGTQLTVALGVITAVEFRWVLQPLVLLLLAALLNKATTVRAAAFTGLSILQAIATGEAVLSLAACFLIIVLFELYYYDKRRPRRANFRRTLLCTITGIAFLGAWFAFLLSRGALDDFLFVYPAFGLDYALIAGIPFTWLDWNFRFAAFACLVGPLAFWFFVASIRARRRFLVEDWVMAAAAILVALYYHKFLGRADGHVYQVYAVSLPLLFYVVYRLISFGEAGLARLRTTLAIRWIPRRHALTLLALALILAFAPVSLADATRRVPMRFDIPVAEEPIVERIGFTNPTSLLRVIQAAPPNVVDESLIDDLRRILDANLGQHDEIFDFTNNPGLFYYLLEEPSPTRYYDVGIAARQIAQQDLIRELARARPKLVAFDSQWTGLPLWDGLSNQIRHYDVSQYILGHYRPLVYSHGFLLLVRNDAEVPPISSFAHRLAEQPVTEDLYFRTFPCDWRYAPNFLSTGPDESSIDAALRIPFHSGGPTVDINGWAIDPASKRPAAEVVVTTNGRVVQTAKVRVDRPDVAAEHRTRSVLRSGFQLTIPNATRRNVDAIRVYAISATQKASELTYVQAELAAREHGRLSALKLGRGRSVPIVQGATAGYVEPLRVEHRLSLSVSRATRRAYHWLEIETRSPLHDNGFTLSDRPSDPKRAISFRTLDRGERTVRVQVGACSSWHGYTGPTLYLGLERPEDVRSIRLYR